MKFCATPARKMGVLKLADVDAKVRVPLGTNPSYLISHDTNEAETAHAAV